MNPALISPSIFRAYDIRGVVDEGLTHEAVYWIGRAFAAQAISQHQARVVIGRDGRISSKAFRDDLCRGLQEGGLDIIDVGQVPTPVVYFAAHHLGCHTAIAITGSHNPPEYNGLKMIIAGETLHGEQIQALYQRICEQAYSEGNGKCTPLDILPAYIERISQDVKIDRPLKVAVDCGNGIAGPTVLALLEHLNCEVSGLYCEVDGTFPNHHPNPSDPHNLTRLIEKVQTNQLDIGLAFDGDGDRLGVVDSCGKIIWADRLLMLFARDILHCNPDGLILYDVKSSCLLQKVIEEAGGKGLMWKSGHSVLKAKISESGALLAGEMSGHIFFADRWPGFDDGIYSAARLLELLSRFDGTSAELFATLPESFSTPEINIPMANDQQASVLTKELARRGQFGAARLNQLDGLRIEFGYGWALVRASNTTPTLVIRFEADSRDNLATIQSLVRQQLLAIDPNLPLPF